MEKRDDRAQRETVKGDPAAPKDRKRYRAPKLQVHGDVKTITKNLGSTNSDLVTGSQLP